MQTINSYLQCHGGVLIVFEIRTSGAFAAVIAPDQSAAEYIEDAFNRQEDLLLSVYQFFGNVAFPGAWGGDQQTAVRTLEDKLRSWRAAGADSAEAEGVELAAAMLQARREQDPEIFQKIPPALAERISDWTRRYPGVRLEARHRALSDLKQATPA